MRKNWREVFQERVERDANYSYRIERFRNIREMANDLGYRLAFSLTPAGLLKMSFVEPKKTKFFGLVRVPEKMYPIEDADLYLDCSCAESAPA